MPRYKFAFPIYYAVFQEENLSFQVADVSFVRKSDLFKESFFFIESNSQFGDNHVFAVVTVSGNESYAKEVAYDKCCFATDIFKICSDLYHNNFFNPKKRQFDVVNDFVTQGKSYIFYKELGNPENSYASFHSNRYPSCIDSIILESVNKWNINDFESLFRVIYSADSKSIHKVIKRACHIYSQSFSINNLYERVVLLCTVLDTLATNERMGKVPQLKKFLPVLILKCDRLSERLRLFIELIYDIRSAYIHNAEEKHITDREVDKLEKIVYRVILQMVRNSYKYESTKELCAAIDNGSFVPIMDNLPDIYV